MDEVWPTSNDGKRQARMVEGEGEKGDEIGCLLEWSK